MELELPSGPARGERRTSESSSAGLERVTASGTETPSGREPARVSAVTCGETLEAWRAARRCVASVERADTRALRCDTGSTNSQAFHEGVPWQTDERHAARTHLTNAGRGVEMDNYRVDNPDCVAGL